MNGPDRYPYRALLCAELLAAPASPMASGDPNRPLLASILAGRICRLGCLPADLGLGGEPFAHLAATYFPCADLPILADLALPAAIPEWSDLRDLLLAHRAGERDSETWLADILATGCAGADHLWQDLGLGSRQELSHLMWVNFPELARANSGDMKWKKFLYRQFCAREGIYTCPAPSCGVCKDFTLCFGPES